MNDGPLRTLAILEELRAITSTVWDGAAAVHQRVEKLLRELGDPRVADIPRHLLFAWSYGTVQRSTSGGSYLHRPVSRWRMQLLMWRLPRIHTRA